MTGGDFCVKNENGSRFLYKGGTGRLPGQKEQMSAKSGYKTRQKDILLNYLEARPGDHITAGEVCEHFRSKGETIAQATIYRRLESLVDEGILNKYVLDANTPACFEYVNPKEHVGGETCFHCKCVKCGKLIHLHCDELTELGEHLLSSHRFLLDPLRTVFYGECEECQKNREKETNS